MHKLEDLNRSEHCKMTTFFSRVQVSELEFICYMGGNYSLGDIVKGSQDTKDAVCMLLPYRGYGASAASYYILQTEFKSVYLCPLT